MIRNTEYSGFNVTSPYKRAVIPFLDELTPEAEALQAVNTIRRLGNGRLVGHNTDVYGFEKMAKEKRVRGRKVLVLGTGGASSAICQALRDRDEDAAVAAVYEHLVLIGGYRESLIEQNGEDGAKRHAQEAAL